MNTFICVPSESSVIRFYFEPEAHENYDPASSKYLSLGDTTWDWFRQVQPLADRLYRNALDDIAGYLASLSHPAGTPEKAEMLVGHLAKAVCTKFARSLAQAEVVSSIPGAFVASPSVREHFVTPRSTIEAIRLAHSCEFQRVVDQLSACQLLGQDSPCEVSFAPENKTWDDPEALKKLYFKTQWLLRDFSRLSGYTLVSTYMSHFQEFILCAMFGRPPIFMDDFSPAYQSRQEAATIRFRGTEETRDVILNLLKAMTPASLIEDFDSTMLVARTLGYPESPKLIFTSNSFYSSDAFKCHLVSCAGKVKYVVGQHGAGYGTSLIREGSPEINTADAFFSWGVVPRKSNFVAVGQLRPRIRTKLPREIRGLTLFLRKDSGSYLTEYSDRGLNRSYILKIIELCRVLNDLGLPVEIKPHAATSDLTIRQLKSAIGDLSNVSFADGQPRMEVLIKRGSLVVFTYDSTGILELASARIPFFFFAADGVDLLRPEIREKYDALERAGLMSQSHLQASQMISQLLYKHRAHDSSITRAVSDFAEGLVSIRGFPLLNLFFQLRKVLKLEAN